MFAIHKLLVDVMIKRAWMLLLLKASCVLRVDKVRESNSCALVHCLAGISRSPTLAIAYIMRYLGLTTDEAYKYVTGWHQS